MWVGKLGKILANFIKFQFEGCYSLYTFEHSRDKIGMKILTKNIYQILIYYLLAYNRIWLNELIINFKWIIK